MKDSLKILFFGFLSWLIPFLFAFLFYTRDQVLSIDEGLFKSIMALVGGLVGATLLVLFFKKITELYLQTAVMVGLLWLAINWLLDFMVLIPLSGMDFNQYFSEIGLRYLMIPIMSTAFGYTLSTHLEPSAAAVLPIDKSSK